MEDRRAAVCMALPSAARLMRLAARITRNLSDAEDAYQRAMEIALVQAPVVEPERFMAWLRVVVRNEALGIAQQRRRESPGRCEDAAEVADRTPSSSRNTGVSEWRERYHTVLEAFDGLSDAQRICLILQARGASYASIEEATGFTRRKVERSILEGRAALRRNEADISTGGACDRMRDAIEAVVMGTAGRTQDRRVARHIQHCGYCRSVFRAHVRRHEALRSLAPVCLMVGQVDAIPPDPTPVLSWFERASVSATVRSGQFMQMVIETPGTMAVKAGATVAAGAVAIGVSTPLIRTMVPTDAPAARATAAPAATTARAVPAVRVRVRVAPRPRLAPTAVPKSATPRSRTSPARPAPARRSAPARSMQRSTPPPSPPPPARPSPPPAPSRPAPRPSSPAPNADAAGAAAISIGPSGP